MSLLVKMFDLAIILGYHGSYLSSFKKDNKSHHLLKEVNQSLI